MRAERRARDPSVRGHCPGVLRPMQTGDGLLVRLRITAGRLDTHIAAAIADLATNHGNGLIDLSNRANLQIRGVTPTTLPQLRDGLVNLGLVGNDQDLEHVRNVLVAPLADDAVPLASEIEAYLSTCQDLMALPAKFGFALDAAGPFSLPIGAADVIYRIADRETYLVSVATSDGSRASDGSGTSETQLGLVPKEDLPKLSVAIAKTFLDHSQDEPTSPSRMRRLLTKNPAAVEAFQALFEPHQDRVCPNIERSEARQAHGIGPAICEEPWVGFGLPFGRLSAAGLRDLARFASDHGDGCLRLTPWRAILVMLDGSLDRGNQAAHNLADQYGLYLDPQSPLAQIAACPGSAGCMSGQFDAQRLAEKVSHETAIFGHDIHISGCAKGCARPRTSDFVIWGTADGLNFAKNAIAGTSMAQMGLTEDEVLSILRQEIHATQKREARKTI